jgi:hypothetical protein
MLPVDTVNVGFTAAYVDGDGELVSAHAAAGAAMSPARVSTVAAANVCRVPRGGLATVEVMLIIFGNLLGWLDWSFG